MKVSTIALALVIGVSVPAAALAQDYSPAQPGDAPAADPAVGADVEAGVDAGIEDWNAFLTGLGTADFTAATGDLSSATTFEIIKLSAMADADAAALEPILTQHEADIQGLRTGISANSQAAAALEAQGVTADQVVWAETDADGILKIYVNDLATM